jgi:uncharacterized glyoxalase superfamily protein PhnB
MKLNRLIPMMWTGNLQETIKFYTEVLGFECAEMNNDWGWCALANGDVDLMFAVPNEHTPFEKPTFTGSLYFNPDDVDELWKDLKEKTKVAYPIDDFEHGMREFAVYDNNGYMLQFGQPISS